MAVRQEAEVRRGRRLPGLMLAAALSASAAGMLALPVGADVIGQNTPFSPLTAERIGELPKDKQAAWLAYLAKSVAQMKADRAALAAELKPGQTPPPPPPDAEGHGNMPLDRDAA